MVRYYIFKFFGCNDGNSIYRIGFIVCNVVILLGIKSLDIVVVGCYMSIEREGI